MEELLDTISAREISEWMAYERAFGPIDHTYTNDILADLKEKVDLLFHVTASANGVKDLDPPEKTYRAHELQQKYKDLLERRAREESTSSDEPAGDWDALRLALSKS